MKHGIDIVTLDQIPDHESLFLKVTFRNATFFLCAVYRAPDADVTFMGKLHDHLLEFKNKNFILTGDFNLPSISWNDLSENSSSSGDILLDIMFALNFEQLVNENTRESSVLDLLFISESFKGGRVVIEPGISDHKMISFSWKKPTVKNKMSLKSSVIKDYKRADDVAIIDYLDEHLGSLGESVEGAWEQFSNAVLYCIENFVPTRKIYKRRLNPWINRDIVHTKRKLKRLRKKHRGPNRIITDLQNELLTKVNTAREKYFSQTLADFLKFSPEKFWRHLKERDEEIDKIKDNHGIITDSGKIAEHFNSYFQSVFADVNEYDLVSSAVFSDEQIEITREGVLKMLLNLDPKKSAGPDGIPNSFLRRYAEQLSGFLTGIFKLSLSSGQIPTNWKIARVVPVYKKGDRLLVENYRPVSITSSCCKLLEHILSSYIHKFLCERDLLSDSQHGFRQGLSTSTQLLLTVNDLLRVLDKSGQADIVFMDFSKAFDKVPHGKLLYKLESIGLPFFVLRWIQVYLMNRKQYVDVKNCFSNVSSVSSGVPQGSVLGPLLFLIYINDLASVTHADVSLRLFADDCVVFKQILSPDDHCSLQGAVSAIDGWCQKWGMDLNREKTVLMRITRKKIPSIYSYKLQDCVISEVQEYKYLGVTFTKNLKWSVHISNICASAMRKLYFLRRKLRRAPVSTKLLAYNTCVRSKLEYAAVIWDPHIKKDIMQLERVNRKAVRFIFGKYRREDSPSQLMESNKIHTLETRRKMSRIAFLYNCLSRKIKLKLPEYVKPLSTRTTRHSHQHSLEPIFAKTNSYQYSFFPRTIKDWNLLPTDLFLGRDFLTELEKHFCY